MTAILDEICVKKAALLRDAELHRLRLAVYYATLERPARVVTRASTFLTNPFVLVGVGLCLVRMPWKGLHRLGRLAWKGWKWAGILKTITRLVPR